MSPATANGMRKSSKERKQLIVLGMLSIALLAVLVAQFGGGDTATDAAGDATAAAPAPAVPVAQASTAAPADAEAGTPAGNPILSEISDSELSRSPFESFWSFAAPVTDTVEELPPPSLQLNATMMSGKTPMALINGQMRVLGDVIQGWTLTDIGTREVTLRSPTKNTVTVAMPLLNGESQR